MKQIPSPAPQPIVLVDDEQSILLSYDTALRLAGLDNIVTCADSRQLVGILEEQGASVVVLDLLMPDLSGEELLPRIVETMPEVPVIVATGCDRIDTAVRCIKQGAFDFIVKPLEHNQFVSTVQQALLFNELKLENTALSESLLGGEVAHPEAFAEIVTNNTKMHSLFRYAEAVSRSSEPVLLLGETGVGKDLLAKAIHRVSAREGDFVPVNIAGLDETAFSDTLFGHLKGAFTGADTERAGLIQGAKRGTLFLDEIGDLGKTEQTKLLRLIQEKQFLPLGSDQYRRSEARLVLATNKDLDALQRSGDFRKDLYYRLCTHRVVIPPLRERLDDVPLLLDRFLEEASEELGKPVPTAPKEITVLLSNYDFPGNVRELRAMVFDAVSQHTSMMLSMEPFKEHIYGCAGGGRPFISDASDRDGMSISFGPKLPTMEQAKELLINEALRRTGGNKSLAATMLGMSRQALILRERRRESGDI